MRLFVPGAADREETRAPILLVHAGELVKLGADVEAVAQEMDALSPQASLGGYVAVTPAAERHRIIFPMMTPACTMRKAATPSPIPESGRRFDR